MIGGGTIGYDSFAHWLDVVSPKCLSEVLPLHRESYWRSCRSHDVLDRLIGANALFAPQAIGDGLMALVFRPNVPKCWIRFESSR